MDEVSFLGISDVTVFMFGLPLVFAMIAFEVVFTSIRNQKYYTKDDVLGTLGLLIGNGVMILLTKSLFVAVLFVAYEYRIFNISEALPDWLLLIVTLLLIDLVFYFWHRACHRVRFIWATHLSHHSSEQFNFSVAFRQAWLAPLFKIPFFAVLPLIGIDPSAVVVVGAISTLYGVWVHTRIVPSLGFLDRWVICTPTNHRVHHGINPQYIDKNYANMFIFYDRIFGTYEEEHEEVIYGLTTQVNTINPITITTLEWKKMFSDMRNAKSLRDMLGYFFGPPDWKPSTISSTQSI